MKHGQNRFKDIRLPDFLRPTQSVDSLNTVQSVLRSFVGMVYIVYKNFMADNCTIRASALAFTTAFSLVPLLAVGFSVSKGFGFQNSSFIYDLLIQFTAGNTDAVEKIIEYINNTDVKTLGVVGVTFLFFTTVSLLGSIESSFNAIWRVQAARNFWRKLSDYFTVVFICPLLIILAISATASLQHSDVVQQMLLNSLASVLYGFALALVPYFSTWLALLFIYTFIPNTKVGIRAAFGGAVVAGTLWQWVQGAYINYQSSLKSYNAIYGSFSQVPMLFLWLFVSWVIVLLGAQICFAIQNRHSYFLEVRVENYSHEDYQKISLLLLSSLTRSFFNGQQPPDNVQLAENLGISTGLVDYLFCLFSKAGLVARLEAPAERTYTLMRSPDKVYVTDVLYIVSRYRKKDYSGISSGVHMLDSVFEDIKHSAQASEKNMPLTRLSEYISRKQETEYE